MAATLDRQEMYRLARMGAESRLRALEQERAQILRSFPGLKSGASAAASTASAAPEAAPRSSSSADVRRRAEERLRTHEEVLGGAAKGQGRQVVTA